MGSKGMAWSRGNGGGGGGVDVVREEGWGGR